MAPWSWSGRQRRGERRGETAWGQGAQRRRLEGAIVGSSVGAAAAAWPLALLPSLLVSLYDRHDYHVHMATYTQRALGHASPSTPSPQTNSQSSTPPANSRYVPAVPPSSNADPRRPSTTSQTSNSIAKINTVSYRNATIKAQIDTTMMVSDVIRQLCANAHLGVQEPPALFALRDEDDDELIDDANLARKIESGASFK